MATNPPVPGPGAVPPSKKTSPLVWILVGVAGFFVFMILLVVAGGFFVLHRARQAGFDPALIQRSPGLAALKMMVAANPDAELVDFDEGRGIVKVRDKKTGKVVTMNFEDVKKGRISFQEEGKEKVSIEAQGEGEAGALTIKSGEGTVKLGAGAARLPDWFPAYAGATPQGTYSMQGQTGQAGSFHFASKDSPEQILQFYENGLKNAGLKVTTLKQDKGGMVTAQDEGEKRKAFVTVGSDSSGAQVTLTFEAKP